MDGMRAQHDMLYQQLPSLRRYTRALTGQRVLADELVYATLESISLQNVSDPRELRLLLFKRLNNVAQATSPWRHENDVSSGSHDIYSVIARIEPLARQAFLLADLEDFSVDEIARILAHPATSVGNLIEGARRLLVKRVSSDDAERLSIDAHIETERA